MFNRYRVCTRIEVRKSSVIYMLININNCWFARDDVTVVCWRSKTKSVSLLWELNSIFMYILRKKICCIDHRHNTNMAALWPSCKPRMKSRLHNSRYFCVSKYTVRTNSLTKAENGERGWKETLSFFLPPRTPVGRERLARFARVRLLPCSFLL